MLTKPHILVVDDDDRIRALLVRFLSQNGYAVSAAESAASARKLLKILAFDLAILDVMMPDETGISLATSLRGTNDMPIIMLTAMGEVQDRIAGLEAGVDDYVAKPFEPRELLLRISAVLRRHAQVQPTRAAGGPMRLGPWIMDMEARALKGADGQMLALSSNDVALLKALSGRAGRPIRREALAEALSLDGNDRTIDVQINRLRKKLGDDPKAPQMIQTVRGQGYLLQAKPLDDTDGGAGA